MRLLEIVADAFINTFGITQPTEKGRRRASWFIAGMLALVVLLIAVAGALLFHIL
jgi:flagellar basal body-associated protein FliL